jgi:ferric-dicitrate binding protein FerR (iron transport regulator)
MKLKLNLKDPTALPPLLFVFLLPVAASALLCSCHNGPSGSTVPADSARQKTLTLAEGVHVLLNPGSVATVTDSGRAAVTVWVDGDGIFRLSGDSALLRTGMLNLYGSRAVFRVQAHRASPGQSVEVLRGSLKAEKAYASAFPDTETLHAGGMVMINKDIDLMEKEVFDTAALAARVKGTLSFHDIPLSALVKKLEDWYGVDITVTGATRGHFSGTFEGRKLAGVLGALSRQAHFTYSIDGYKVRLRFP